MKPMKGFMEQGIQIALGILFVGVVAGVAAITLNGFATGQTGTTLNILNNASAGVLNFSQQMPTIGLVGGISIVLLILFSAVAVFMPRR